MTSMYTEDFIRIVDSMAGMLPIEVRAALLAAIIEEKPVDWTAILMVVKALIDSLVEKEIFAAKNGFDGPWTAGVKAHERCTAEMAKEPQQ